MENIAIKFDNVSKVYKLYKNDRAKLLSVFSRKKGYKMVSAIDHISFEIKKGESVALLGRNGAGKSTLLKLITGVNYLTEGEITVNGRVSALLELSAGFDPEFTGLQNIYFRGRLLGLKDKEIKALEPEIIEFADLGDYIHQPVRTYSSGMKARLGFAINANVNPEILIVDEALSVGDKIFRKKCKDKINDLLQNNNITFLFVTHSTSSAKQFCNRGLVMKKGKLLYDNDIDSAVDYYDELVKTDNARIKKYKAKKEKERAESKILG